MLVPDLVAATKLHEPFFGLALVVLGDLLQFYLRLARQRPAERPTQYRSCAVPPPCVLPPCTLPTAPRVSCVWSLVHTLPLIRCTGSRGRRRRTKPGAAHATCVIFRYRIVYPTAPVERSRPFALHCKIYGRPPARRGGFLEERAALLEGGAERVGICLPLRNGGG